MNDQHAKERWRRVFERVHGELWRLVREFDADGLLVAAVEDERTVVAQCRAAREMSPFHATVGTHERCELRLPEDDDSGVDVRHVVIRYDAPPYQPTAIAAFDLDTATGFEIENGESRRAVTAEGGPLFIRVGSADVMALPITRPPWSADAEATWRTFAARKFVGERRLFNPPPKDAHESRVKAPRAIREDSLRERHDRTTRLSWSQPPVAIASCAGTRDDDDSPVRGTLAFGDGREQHQRVVTVNEIARGILVGRLPRCAFRGESDRLSRIHLALVDVGGALWAIDTASTNGTTFQGARLRAGVVEDSAVFRLASEFNVVFKAVS